MKKALKWTGYIIIVLVLVAVGYLFYLGAFSKVTVSEQEVGPYQLAYKVHYGSYKDISKTIMDVNSSLEALGVKTIECFGIYYDDPKSTPEKMLRSIGGCIIEGADLAKLPQISKIMAVNVLPKTNSVVAEIPFRGMPSILLGLIKVYPKLTEYKNKMGYKGSPIMELYDGAEGKIMYISPVIK